MADLRQWSYFFGRWIQPGNPCFCFQTREPNCPVHGSQVGHVRVKYKGRTALVALDDDNVLDLDTLNYDVASLLSPFSDNEYLLLLGVTPAQLDAYQRVLADRA